MTNNTKIIDLMIENIESRGLENSSFQDDKIKQNSTKTWQEEEQQFINQGGKDVLKELENKNIIEEITSQFRREFSEYTRPKTIATFDAIMMANLFEDFLRSSLQKAINAEKKIPYNVSEWKKIGIERGYWKYFEEEIRNAERERCLGCVGELQEYPCCKNGCGCGICNQVEYGNKVKQEVINKIKNI